MDYGFASSSEDYVESNRTYLVELTQRGYKALSENNPTDKDCGALCADVIAVIIAT